jgi:hypothetical protein
MKPIHITFIPIFIIITLMHSPKVSASNPNKTYAIQKFLVDEANRQQIDPALALAIAKVESDFNPRALSHAGAKGIMQIMPATAEGVFGVSRHQLFDAKTNITLGISFIKKLLTRYDQRADIALSHYNGGSAVRDKSGRLSVIPATKKYVNKVLSAKEDFKYKAYHLSSDPSQGTLKSDSRFMASTNILGKKKTTVSPMPVNKTETAKVLKPSFIASSEPFDQALYEKVEKLRTLRTHNIMRNSKNVTIASYTTPYKSKGLTKTKLKHSPKRHIPLSEKRSKVLSWEKMFN